MYSGETVSLKGQTEIKFSYEGNKIKHTFLITDKHSRNILTRDILGKLQLNQKDIFNSFAASEVSSNSENVTLNKIITEYKVVFSDELGALKDFQANIPTDPHITPKYFHARPVMYSLKEKIEHNLEQLVKLGMYQPVASSSGQHPQFLCLKGMVIFKFVAIINSLLIRQHIVTNTLSQKQRIFLQH